MQRVININLVLIVGLGLVSVLVQSLSNIGTNGLFAQTTTLIVCPQSGSACDYTSIQSAVDDANDGDVIKVASGTFTDVHSIEGTLQVVYITKSITIQGGYTTSNWITPNPEANSTILDAQGNGRVLYITGNITPTIEGLYITGGTADELGGGIGGNDAGGGVYVVAAAANISHSQIYSNEAVLGGGLYFSNSNNATLRGNTITSNTGESKAGGIFFQNGSKATLIANTISNNEAVGEENPFESKDYGGVFFLSSHEAVLVDNIIQGNMATDYCGGLCFAGSDDITLVNNVIIDNQSDSPGNGLYISGSSIQLLQTTIARNYGGDGIGIHVDNASTVALTNTIIAGHQTGINLSGGSTANLNGVLWFSNTMNIAGMGWAIAHAYTGDPAFMTDGYHLTASSEAINKGVSTNVSNDIDGDPRPFGPGLKYDIGADEFSSVPGKPPLLPIVNPDGDGDYLVDWISVTHAVTYTLQEDNNENFLSPNTIYNGPDTEFQVSDQDGGTWYYRVNASNLAGTSEWSGYQSVVVTAYVYLPVVMNCYTPYFEGPWEAEPNDDPPFQANGAIHSGVEYYGNFTSTIDVKDYYYFHLCESHTVELWLNNIPAGQDYDLVLRDANLTEITRSDKISNADEHILPITLSSGLYFVQVYHFSGPGSTQAYHLRVVYE